jgi:GxxExxY protein
MDYTEGYFKPSAMRAVRVRPMDTGLVHGGDFTRAIIGLAMRVQRRLGPRLLESAYQACLCRELHQAELPFRRQVPLRVRYDGVHLDCGYIADIIVRDEALLELKSVERMRRLFQAQLLTYMRLADCRIGLLINFNTVSLTDGLQRCVL